MKKSLLPNHDPERKKMVTLTDEEEKRIREEQDARQRRTARRKIPKRRPPRNKYESHFSLLKRFADVHLQKDLTASELKVWIYLFQHAKKGIVETTHVPIMEYCNYSKKTVSVAINGLMKKGLIKRLFVGRPKRGRHESTMSKYRILYMMFYSKAKRFVDKQIEYYDNLLKAGRYDIDFDDSTIIDKFDSFSQDLLIDWLLEHGKDRIVKDNADRFDMETLLDSLERHDRDDNDFVSWTRISMSEGLYESFIKKYKDKVDWYSISTNQRLTESFIERYQDRVCWNEIFCCQDHLSERFVGKHYDKIEWELTLESIGDYSAFIRKFPEYVDWKCLKRFEDDLPDDFKVEFHDKLQVVACLVHGEECNTDIGKHLGCEEFDLGDQQTVAR